MPNFHDTFETGKRSFISAFSICMTAPLMIGCFTTMLSMGYTKLRYEPL